MEKKGLFVVLGLALAVVIYFMIPTPETVESQQMPSAEERAGAEAEAGEVVVPAVEDALNYGSIADWKVVDLNGEPYRIADLDGTPIFINFWATWCKPCIAEFPSIVRLYESLKDENVAFMMISDEEMGIVKRFVERNGYDFPIYLQQAEVDLPEALRTFAIPTSFVANANGDIVFKRMGMAEWDSEDMKAFLRELGQS